MAGAVTGGPSQLISGGGEMPEIDSHDLGNSLGSYARGVGEAEGTKNKKHKSGVKATKRRRERVNQPDKLIAPVFTVGLAGDTTPEQLRAAAAEVKGGDNKSFFRVDMVPETVAGGFVVRPERDGSNEMDALARTTKLLKKELKSGLKKQYQEIAQGEHELTVTAKPGKSEAVRATLSALYNDRQIQGYDPQMRPAASKALVTVKSGIREDKLEVVQEENPAIRQITQAQGAGLITEHLGTLVDEDEIALKDTVNFPAKFYPGSGLQRGYLEALRANPNLSQDLKINEYASPEVGGAFAIAPVGEKDQDGDIYDVHGKKWRSPSAPYHWAGVVAKSGNDVVTLENFSRGSEMGSDDPRNYFAMYGRKREVEVGDDDKLSAKKPDDENSWEEGTFHGKWKGTYPNAITAAFAGTKKG